MLESMRLRREAAGGGDAIREKAVLLDGVKVATLITNRETLIIRFPPLQHIDPLKSRAACCNVKRREVVAILKHLCYKNLNDNLSSDLKKVLLVTANDGLPHSSCCTIEIAFEPIDDATEFRRADNTQKLYRPLSLEDTKGFCLFSDVTLFDPDTFAFNGSTLVVDLVGGGDLKSDQLALLTEHQQRLRGVADDQFVVVDSRTERIYIGNKHVGSFSIGMASVSGSSQVTCRFVPYPSSVSTGKRLPKSIDEAEADPDAVTILHVEKILNSITYCCTTTSFKTGVRIYQAQLFVDAVESRIKVSVDVQPPLLYNPQFGAELTYREGAEPVLLFPKLLFTASEKVIYKRGHVMVDFNDVVDDGFDRLDFAPKTGFTVQKSGQ